MYKLPTRKQCFQMVADNEVFTHKAHEVEGVTVDVFGYRLAWFNDFDTPYATEMRGISFVEEERFIALHKFFNVNQHEETELSALMGLEIASIAAKEDGSMISFIRLNDKIIAKTKNSFVSDQAISANNLLSSNPSLYAFIFNLIKAGKMPIFEFVSPRNRIVLEYKSTALKLLAVRDMHSGAYLDLESIGYQDYGLKRAPLEPLVSLVALVDRAKAATGIEGWVVTFKNSFKIKVKTSWYFEMHKLVLTNIQYENVIIRHVIEDTIDDVLCQVSDEIKEYITYVAAIVREEHGRIRREVTQELKISWGSARGWYARRHSKDKYFNIVMKVWNADDRGKALTNAIDQCILKRTNKLEKARLFLKELRGSI